MAVELQIAIARILADLNLAVRYRIAIRIYANRKFWRILIWRGVCIWPEIFEGSNFRGRPIFKDFAI